jgi:hypothetical protein
MYITAMVVILLFPWSILGIMLLRNVSQHLCRASVRSR